MLYIEADQDQGSLAGFRIDLLFYGYRHDINHALRDLLSELFSFWEISCFPDEKGAFYDMKKVRSTIIEAIFIVLLFVGRVLLVCPIIRSRKNKSPAEVRLQKALFLWVKKGIPFLSHKKSGKVFWF